MEVRRRKKIKNKRTMSWEEVKKGREEKGQEGEGSKSKEEERQERNNEEEEEEVEPDSQESRMRKTLNTQVFPFSFTFPSSQFTYRSLFPFYFPSLVPYLSPILVFPLLPFLSHFLSFLLTLSWSSVLPPQSLLTSPSSFSLSLLFLSSRPSLPRITYSSIRSSTYSSI